LQLAPVAGGTTWEPPPRLVDRQGQEGIVSQVSSGEWQGSGGPWGQHMPLLGWTHHISGSYPKRIRIKIISLLLLYSPIRIIDNIINK
jgi:hypothetical protein